MSENHPRRAYYWQGPDKQDVKYPVEVAMDNLFLPVGGVCLILFGFGFIYGVAGTVGMITYGATRIGINRYRVSQERKKMSSVNIPK